MINVPVAFAFCVAGVLVEILQFISWLPPRPLYHRIGLLLIGTGIGFVIPIHAYIDGLVIGGVLVIWDVVRHRREKRRLRSKGWQWEG